MKENFENKCDGKTVEQIQVSGTWRDHQGDENQGPTEKESSDLKIEWIAL